ncbi:DUF4440 domain-containing protein [Geojedonia litorea]|uniref:DUF4440 domain-containing protein n=1 Tax=Geojedonia litorea TaxID=1268269 RepID=A0ABV9N3R5_9FLAO
MKHILFQSLLLLFTLGACTPKTKDSTVQWKAEILDAETQFAALVKEKGLHEAFVAFADEDAVLMRNNALIIGKKAIDERYKGMNSKNLTWTPDFIDVSKSGDLGYTYGEYQFKYTDSTGIEHTDTGIFHSVWKRQKNGSWKYVWD